MIDHRKPTTPAGLLWVAVAAATAVVAYGLTRRPEVFLPGVSVTLPAMPWWLLLLLAIALATVTAFVFRKADPSKQHRGDDGD